MTDYSKMASARIKSMYNDLLVMDKRSSELEESLQSTTISLQERKRNMEKLGLKFEDFKSDIKKVSMEHYELETLGINIRHLVSSLYESLLQLSLMELTLEEIGFEPDVVERVKSIAEQARPVYTSDKDELVVANQDLHRDIFQSVEAKVSNDEMLKKTFEMIPTDSASVM